VTALSSCRTPALGGTVWQCHVCGQRDYRYRSCGNRHCPKCQAGCRAAWLEREAGYLLPVEYHHVVFTLPEGLADLARHHPRVVYGLLFEAASRSVQELAADPRYLGAQVGLVAVLHTWGQTLSLHPHLHVLATGGGLSCDRSGQIDAAACWRSCRPGFFLPVRVLSRLFRGKFLAGLRQAQAAGRLRLPPTLSVVGAWPALLAKLVSQEWVVYSQPPCAGPEVVLKYLARYVYRVAISNSRLVRVSDQEVTFGYKDYRRNGQDRELTLSGEEFARRFLQHVLPTGFVRIRHYGLLANRGRQEKLRQCRRLLAMHDAQQAKTTPLPVAGPELCVRCGEGEMRLVERLPPAAAAEGERCPEDTS
jgi:Putative transposase/Transposase zinc-binding domain